MPNDLKANATDIPELIEEVERLRAALVEIKRRGLSAEFRRKHTTFQMCYMWDDLYFKVIRPALEE